MEMPETCYNQISFLLLWMDKLMRQESTLKLVPTGSLLNLFDVTTKQTRTGSACAAESGVLNR